jgi:hypothetical protein
VDERFLAGFLRYHDGMRLAPAAGMSDAARPPKLLDRVRLAIRTRHYRRRTEEAYLGWVRRYILFHRKRHPRKMGKAEVTAFLEDLADRRHVAASTQNQALSALLFLYKEVLGRPLPEISLSERPRRLPEVLTRDEVRRVLAQMSGVPHLVVSLLYGSGRASSFRGKYARRSQRCTGSVRTSTVLNCARFEGYRPAVRAEGVFSCGWLARGLLTK